MDNVKQVECEKHEFYGDWTCTIETKDGIEKTHTEAVNTHDAKMTRSSKGKYISTPREDDRYESLFIDLDDGECNVSGDTLRCGQ